MQPKFITIEDRKIVGKKVQMSLIHNKTQELWQSFMPLRKHVENAMCSDLYSITNYSDASYFQNFSPNTEFEKWAGIEVSDFERIPDSMHAFVISGGLYAVFHYKGLSSDTAIFQYIYSEWLPKSGYVLEHRPHFEILGENYKNNDPDSEVEIWIPVKHKN